MVSKWKHTTLGDIALSSNGAVDGPFGSNLPAAAYTDSGYPIIRGSNLSVGLDEFKDSDFVFVPEHVFQKLSRSECRAGDIIFTKKGTLGQTGLISTHHRFKQYLLSSNQMRLRVDPDKALPEYVYYCVSSQKAINKLIQDSECTGVPKINLAYLKSFPISLPNLDEQKNIVDVLGSINKKITLNRRINQTQEQMAQALFKSWFVDFDPVIDNALDAGFFEQNLAIPEELRHRAELRKAVSESADFKPLPEDIRQLFPAAFEKCSEPSLGLGSWVPEGWIYKTADNIADISIGKTPPRKESEWFSEQKTNNTTWVSIRDMGLFGTHTGNTSEYLTADAIKKFNIKKVPKGSILLSFKLTLGRVAISSEELTTNEAIAHFVEPKYDVNTPYLYCYLSNFNYETLGSTSSIATAVNSKIIKKMPILVPTKNSLNCFKKQSEPLFGKMKSLDDETVILTKLRDTLLPKLISGELRLDKIEVELASEGMD